MNRIPTTDADGHVMYAAEESPGDLAEWDVNDSLQSIQRVELPENTALGGCEAFCNFKS